MMMSGKKWWMLGIGICFGLSVAAQNRYELVWKENFCGRTMDDRYWSKISRGRADWRRYMSDHESLFDLRRGCLVLRGVANDGVDPRDTARFLTAGVYTKGKFSLRCGKVEVRARLQEGQGVWPAIWLLPEANRPWPDGGEIDIMEHLNFDPFVYQTVHTRYTHTLKNKTNPPHTATAPIRPGRFNVYGVEILPDRLVFSVNGRTTFEYPRIETKDEYLQFPFGTPYYLLIDMQIEGAWVGPADPAHLPVEMEVDWVRVYGLK